MPVFLSSRLLWELRPPFGGGGGNGTPKVFACVWLILSREGLSFSCELTFYGMLTGGVFLRSDYIFREEFSHVLAALTVPNRLALELSLVTGLRISDVLSLPTGKLAQRMTVKESKTGKSKRIYIPGELLERLQRQAGKYYVFEGRNSPKRPRTRQAVYKDLKRACRLFRLPKALQISPHSARKIYAVDVFHKTGSLKRVQQLLNHADEAVTMVYAMADQMAVRRRGQGSPLPPIRPGH